jgi:hypothetical protein
MESEVPWYTEDFMTASMVAYLKEKGYAVKIRGADEGERTEKLLMAYKWGSRAIIEMKGYVSSTASGLRKAMFQKAFPENGANWFQKNLLTSLQSLARQYKDAHLPVSLCLPDVERYREILDKVEEYFTTNNLHLNVYLVKEDGTVQVFDLNTTNRTALEKKETPTVEEK